MSESENSHDIPQFEPWLGVLVSSFIPLAVAGFVHGRFVVPLLVVTAGIFLASLVMLRRQTVRRRLEAS